MDQYRVGLNRANIQSIAVHYIALDCSVRECNIRRAPQCSALEQVLGKATPPLVLSRKHLSALPCSQTLHATALNCGVLKYWTVLNCNVLCCI